MSQNSEQQPCRWCAQGDTPEFLDADGTMVSITGNDGILSHAYEEYWWPCLKFGVEMRSVGISPASAAPVVDEKGVNHNDHNVTEWRKCFERRTSTVPYSDEHEILSEIKYAARIIELLYKEVQSLRAAAATTAPQVLFEAKLLGFGEEDRIQLCEPCLKRAIDEHLVSFSSALPAAPAVESNRLPHAFQEHPHYPNYCAFAVGDEDYCKRETDNVIHQVITAAQSQ